MGLKFNGSAHPTLGIEIELQILDPQTLDLTPRAEDVLSRCKAQGLPRVKAEVHQSMLEVDSEISVDVKQCRDFLQPRMRQLNEIAASLGLKIGVTGTHPSQHWKDRLISNHPRYRYFHEKFQWQAQRVNVYGLHVHIGVPSGDRALALSKAMTHYLPHLLALSANSPFWHGVDTGMHSARINVMEVLPFSGVPPLFKNWKEFEYYYDTLHRTGVIRSLKDLYWFIRPNVLFGTLEFRICDAPTTLSDTMAVVALIQTLTAWTNQKLDAEDFSDLCTQEELWIAPDNLWTAARDGLSGMIISDTAGNHKRISDEILLLVEKLTPLSRELNCYEELQHVKQIIHTGNGADTQRKIYHETGSLTAVIDSAQHAYVADLEKTPAAVASY